MPSDDDATLAAFLDELRREFPHFRIIPKAHSRLSRAIDLALRALTFGQMRTFMTQYHTVIGDTLYVPPGWDHTSPISQVLTLRHERVHLRQRRRYTLPGMAFLYLCPLFPLGLAYGRARIEWEAYTETILATAELCGVAAAKSPHLREHIVTQFLSPSYGWMWPFRSTIEGWYDEVIATLPADH